MTPPKSMRHSEHGGGPTDEQAAARFAKEGMASLFAPRVQIHRTLPATIRELMRELKAEHPPFRPNEIATIRGTRLEHRPSPHTVKRILADDPPVPVRARRFPLYQQSTTRTTGTGG